jgi:uncharacterized damage-inducible protein DinB
MQDKSLYSAAPAYYTYYFDLIESNNLLHELRENGNYVADFITSIPEDKWHSSYAPEKWTVAEVVRHIIETERIFAYRALRFSRFDITPLPGFNENEFIAHLSKVQFSKEHSLREFQTLRESTLSLFETMSSEMLVFMGNANGLSMSAEMLGFMIVGHTLHHCGIIEERYLLK